MFSSYWNTPARTKSFAIFEEQSKWREEIRKIGKRENRQIPAVLAICRLMNIKVVRKDARLPLPGVRG
jgi:hypothetical protein